MVDTVRVVQGSNLLAYDSAEVIIDTVERMHETIARRPLFWSPVPPRPGRAHGLIASSVYHSIRKVNGALREGTRLLFQLIPEGVPSQGYSPAQVRAVAALNGVFGDHLEATANPLAIGMSLHLNGEPLEIGHLARAGDGPAVSPDLVIFVHGLSLSELSWSRNDVRPLGDKLQDELGYTPLYLRYNTGRHISSNGREFSALLDNLLRAWPVPVESLTLIGHSMGGLVIRSAGWYGSREQRRWIKHLRRVVCLGTPHHGSPLERAGHAFDVAIARFPYLAPLALGRHRSAGIKDLSHGDLLDEDWQDHQPHRPRVDNRRAVPLLRGVDYYFVAATLGKDGKDPLGHVLGDLLVRLDSALGSHGNRLKKLEVREDHCRVFPEKNHFDLLDDARVHEQILEWFRGGAAPVQRRPQLPSGRPDAGGSPGGN